MSDRQLSVRIIAKDDASKAFKAIGDSASKAADELEKAGDEGSKGLGKIEQEARKAGPELDRVGDSAQRAGVDLQAMGLALTAVGAGLVYAGNLAMEHERLVVGVQQAYKDASADMIDFADTLAADIGNLFNDTDILAGERYFATLVNNYGVSIAQVQDLMRTTADLAAVANVTFEDASNRVTAAIRGEAEAAEYLGLTMNQQAIDRENLTLSMTNQEAAQFRINALNEQAVWSVGAAGAVAETSAGQWASLTNQMKDGAQAVGEYTGVSGAMIAGMGSAAVGLAQFAGGFTALAGGIRLATTASLAFVATPVGAAVTALGIGLAVAGKMWFDYREEVKAAEEQHRSMVESIEDLNTQISSLRLEDWWDADWANRMTTDIRNEFDWQGKWLRDTLMKSFNTGDWFDQMVWETGSIPMFAQMGEIELAWQEQADKLIDAMIPDDADRQRFEEAFADLLSLRDVLGPTHWDAIQGEMSRLWQAFNAGDGQVTVDDFNASLERLYRNNLQASQGIELTTIAQNRLNAEQQKWMDLGMGSVGEMTTEMGEYTSATQTAAGAVMLLARNMGELLGYGADRLTPQAQAAGSLGSALADGTRLAVTEMDNFGDSAAGALITVVTMAAEMAKMRGLGQAMTGGVFDAMAISMELTADQIERVLDLATSVTGMDNPLTAFNATSMASSASELAGAFASANANASDLYRVLVGNTDQIKSQADATLKWAEELINVRGELGRIDELVEKGLLTGQSGVFDDGSQYAAAQDAYDSIAISTERINDNLDAIQAIQSPMIAAMQEQQAAYTEELLKQPAAVQLTALAWMDAATASRAFEIQALAASAATGELGTNGVAAMTSYIDSIVQAEPATAALLEELGLIQNVVRDSSGMILSYEVDLSGAEGAQSEISLLTESIDRLTAAILGIPVAELYADDQATPVIENVISAFDNYEGKKATGYVLGNNSDAMGVIDESSSALGALDGDSATVYIYAQDLASGLLGGVSAMINAIDGRTATTYVRTVSMQETQALGGIPGAAIGGIPVELAEWGPERLHYANGGTAMAYDRGIYSVPPMTYVSPNHATGSRENGGLIVQVPIYGNVYGMDDLTQQVSRELVPVVVQVVEDARGSQVTI